MQMTPDETLYKDIDALILATDDPKDRAIIMIMQRILLKVEAALADEKSIQAIALNGLTQIHPEDHALVSRLRAMEVEKAIEWVNEFKSGNPHEVCEFSRQQMQILADSKKITRRKIDEELFNIGRAIVYLALGAALFGFAAGYPLLSKLV
jgi:hypothetical protein